MLHAMMQDSHSHLPGAKCEAFERYVEVKHASLGPRLLAPVLSHTLASCIGRRRIRAGLAVAWLTWRCTTLAVTDPCQHGAQAMRERRDKACISPVPPASRAPD